MTDAEKKVRSIIAEYYRIPESEVKGESSFITDFDGDSLDIIELVLTLEDKYGIEISEEVAEGLDTVQKVYDYVNSLSK